MAEKAIRLGGESTAAAITQTVDGLYPEHKFNEADFTLKHNDDEIAVDSNFAAQSFWKDARIRFLRKKSAVLGLILIVFIVLLASLSRNDGFLVTAYNTAKCKADHKVAESFKTDQHDHSMYVIDTAHNNRTVAHELCHIYHFQERSIFDHCDHLA